MPFYKNEIFDPVWESFEKHCIETQLKFVFWPKHCHVSHKVLWLEYAYKKTAMYTGPGDPVYAYRWYDRHEYIIEQLKR